MNASAVAAGLASLLMIPAASISAGPRARDAHTSAVAAARNLPEEAIRRPRYEIEALHFVAINETGWDRLFSDEVFVVVFTGRGFVTVSRIFGDVDAGEGRHFGSDQNCIVPIVGVTGEPAYKFDSVVLLKASSNSWTCSKAGAEAPFVFIVEMYEEDSGFFHDCIPGCGFSPAGSTSDTNDDLIGRVMVTLTTQDLAVLLDVGDTYDETVTLGGPCGHVEPGGTISACPGQGPEYTFTYRIKRLPDAEPVAAPVIGQVRHAPTEAGHASLPRDVSKRFGWDRHATGIAELSQVAASVR